MTGGFFDFSASEKITDIGTSPAVARLEVEVVSPNTVK
jgi:hypothetical protein